MTTVHNQRPITSAPESGYHSFAPLPKGHRSFSQLFEEQSEANRDATLASYAASTDVGSEGQKRQQHGTTHETNRPPIAHSSGALSEKCVRTVEITSEKCQLDDVNQMTYPANPQHQRGKRHSNPKYPYGENNPTKNPNKSLNQRNESIINPSGHIASPQTNSLNGVNNAFLLLPQSEFKKLVRVLRNTSLSKRSSVFLTLDLKDLGEVRLDVTLKEKQVFIIAHVANRKAAAALTVALGELKKQLESIDLCLEGFEISNGTKTTKRISNGSSISAQMAMR